MIAALYVCKDGIYKNDPRIDPWDIEKDARLYKGPYKIIAHPPCKRWGRFWSGGPMLAGTPNQKLKGDDGGCFAHAIWAVRTFGGVIEHPEASHAYKWYGLILPHHAGGWIKADIYGGFTCCVAQGNYGHRAQKLTWLYAVNTALPELKWGKCKGKIAIGEKSIHSKDAGKVMRAAKDFKACERISAQERLGTPSEFKELLVSVAQSRPGGKHD